MSDKTQTTPLIRSVSVSSLVSSADSGISGDEGLSGDEYVYIEDEYLDKSYKSLTEQKKKKFKDLIGLQFRTKNISDKFNDTKSRRFVILDVNFDQINDLTFRVVEAYPYDIKTMKKNNKEMFEPQWKTKTINPEYNYYFDTKTVKTLKIISYKKDNSNFEVQKVGSKEKFQIHKYEIDESLPSFKNWINYKRTILEMSTEQLNVETVINPLVGHQIVVDNDIEYTLAYNEKKDKSYVMCLIKGNESTSENIIKIEYTNKELKETYENNPDSLILNKLNTKLPNKIDSVKINWSNKITSDEALKIYTDLLLIPVGNEPLKELTFYKENGKDNFFIIVDGNEFESENWVKELEKKDSKRRTKHNK